MFHGLTQKSTVHINRYIFDTPVALLLGPLETVQPQLSAVFFLITPIHPATTGHLFMLLTGQSMATNTHLCVSLFFFSFSAHS